MKQASDPFMLLRNVASSKSVAAAAAAVVEASRSRDEEDDSFDDDRSADGGLRRKSKATALLLDPSDYLNNSDAMSPNFAADSESIADVPFGDDDNFIESESTLAEEKVEDNGVIRSPDNTISNRSAVRQESRVSSVEEPAETNCIGVSTRRRSSMYTMTLVSIAESRVED